MRNSISIWIALVAVSTLNGCGSNNAPETGQQDNAQTAEAAASPSPEANPCSYISAKEMAEITSDPVIDTVVEDNSCTYKTRHNDNLRIAVSLHDGAKQMAVARRAVGVTEGMGATVADKGGAGADVAAMTKRSADDPQVGDDAIWGMVGILYARKGEAYVEVYPPTIHDPTAHKGNPLISQQEKRKIVTTVADKVFAKLGA